MTWASKHSFQTFILFLIVRPIFYRKIQDGRNFTYLQSKSFVDPRHSDDKAVHGSDLPDMGHSPFVPVESFIITVPGVTKLLKSSGPDGIVPRLLFEFSEQLAPPLTFIFNKSIESGIVPEDWRQANVAPIFKKGEKYYKPSNYRPVSLT